ncbi:MAG: hypothetical protein V4563_15015 [Pseudomonadota bacterium]
MKTTTKNIADIDAQESFLPKWAVVENAGTDSEEIIREFMHWGEASRFRNYCGRGFDLMKRDENGYLTTEF